MIGYCRLQQTCKHVLQLAQTSRNITVFMEGDYRMGWRKEDGDFQAYFDGFVSNKRRELEDLDKFPHGIRFETLIIEAHSELFPILLLLKIFRVWRRIWTFL